MQSIKGQQVCVTVPQTLLDAIDCIAAEQRLSRARIMRVLLVSAVLRDWSEKGLVLETEDEDLGEMVSRMLGAKD